MPAGTLQRPSLSPFDWLAAWERRHPRLFLAVLCGVGLLLRLRGYTTRPLWFDEAEQYVIAAGSGLFDVIRRLNVLDRNPPGFSLLLHYLTSALGTGVAILRLPSLLGGTAAIVLAWAAGRCWLGRRAGIGLALLATALPTWVFYAREARPYATGLLLIFALMHAVALRVHRPGRWTAAYVLGAGVATVLWQYASVFVVLAALAAGASWEVHLRGRHGPVVRYWLAAAGLVGAVALASVVAFQLPQMKSNGVKSAFFLQYLFTWGRPVLAARFVGARLGEYLEYLASGTELSLPGRLACALAWAPLAAALLWARWGSGRDRAVLWFAGFPLVILIVLAGFQVHPFGPIRHCLPLAPGVLLLLAAGWTRLRRRGHGWAADASLAALLGLAAFGDWTVIPRWHDHDLRGLLAQIQPQMDPDDGVVFSIMAGSVHRYYEAELPPLGHSAMYCDAVKKARAGVDDPGLGTEEIGFEGLLARSLPHCRRLWLLSIHEDPRPLESLLAHQARREDEIDRPNARASLWVRDAVSTAAHQAAPPSRK